MSGIARRNAVLRASAWSSASSARFFSVMSRPTPCSSVTRPRLSCTGWFNQCCQPTPPPGSVHLMLDRGSGQADAGQVVDDHLTLGLWNQFDEPGPEQFIPRLVPEPAVGVVHEGQRGVGKEAANQLALCVDHAPEARLPRRANDLRRAGAAGFAGAARRSAPVARSRSARRPRRSAGNARGAARRGTRWCSRPGAVRSDTFQRCSCRQSNIGAD